ncbi:MAG: hypothetical protein QOK28_589 [Actinomycetota bacterium]|jgi:parallel beta-helix repeat protein
MTSTKVRSVLLGICVVAALLVGAGRVDAQPYSIQAAIDAAPVGGTVVVPAGVFRQEIVIAKDLTLIGAGVDRTIIQAPAHMTPYGTHLPDGRDLLAIVRVWKNAHVRISQLTVRGPIPCKVEVTGVHALLGATLDLSNARVTAIQADPATCGPNDAAGRAIVYGTPPHIRVNGRNGSNAFGSVSRVMVDHFQHAGISVGNADTGKLSQVSINQSTILGGWTIPTFQANLWLEGRVVVDVLQNVIDNSVCGGPFGCGSDPIFEGQGIGVLLLFMPPGSHVMGNSISGNDVGITQAVSPNCCTISGNTLVNNRYFGIIVQDGNGATNGNKISGGRTGIAAVADGADTTEVSTGDRVWNTNGPAFREIECCGYNATLIVR